ncbi:MarR family winged helix-turn-helix transcriptional regulator [Cohnella boryungensis]|uniref:MarR family winged helix-turn-helix transcriptional regulator n=1 Tax=Cohnella boryungensis TaxID=768479 RepID=A0ABV8SIH1_9BACL
MELPIEENRDRLTYWLFFTTRCVTTTYAEVLRAHCEGLGKTYIVTPPQWGALSLLLAQDGMVIGTMSQIRGIDASAVTGIVTRLEQMGLVERRLNKQDRRVIQVFLTEEGREISKSLATVVERFELNLKNGFTDGEMERFYAHLQQMITNAAEISKELGQ